MCEEDQWWVLLFVAGAVFGEVQVSLFVAGAVFGEIWNDSRSAKRCIFQYKMLVVGVKSNLGCEAGCGLTVPWDSKKLKFLASCSRLSFLSQEATSRSLFFWLPASFLSFLAFFWCSRSLIFKLLGSRSCFLAQEAASWKVASLKPKKPLLEAKKTSFLKSPRSYFLKSKKLVFLASRKHVQSRSFGSR